MVNFRDPAVIAQDALVLAKLWHTIGGLYIWEFFTTLEYEWSVIWGRRPYRWTILIHSLARVAALLVVILCLIQVDNKNPINCQVAMSFTTVFTFLTVSASSLLIVLRIIAIWNRNNVAVAMAISILIMNTAVFLQGRSLRRGPVRARALKFTQMRLVTDLVRSRFVWVPAQQTCVRVKIGGSELALVAVPVADIALLLIMLVGLLRLRLPGGGMSSLAQVLWRQGTIWLLLAIVAEIPPVVFILLNLNAPFNVMFEMPAWVIMAIAATRMHRSLVDFVSGPTNVIYARENQQNINPEVQETMQIVTTSSQMEVSVHIVSEQHGSSQMRDGVSRTSTIVDDRMHEKPNGVVSDDDVERGV